MDRKEFLAGAKMISRARAAAQRRERIRERATAAQYQALSGHFLDRIQMRITEWRIDEHGNLWREIWREE